MTLLMDDPLFEVPAALTDAMYAKLAGPSNSDLTTGTVGGTGAFDVLMAGINAHLKAEFDKGRITGADYTHAYIALTQAALQTALQFTLQADTSFWQTQQAQVGAITGRVALETAKVQHDTAAYNLTTTLPAQTSLLNAQIASSQFQVTYMLPAQLVLVNEQMEAQRAATLDVRADGVPVVGSIGMQKALYSQQIVSYKRDAEVKAAKPFTDAWITQKTVDDALDPPNGFTNANLDIVLSTLMARNAFNGGA